MKSQRSLILFVALLFAPAAPAASLFTIDQGPVAGRVSLAIGSDGLPVIAYRTLTARVRIAKCRDIDCAASMPIDIGDPPTGMTAGLYASLAIAPDGHPAIAFKDTIDNQLKLVKCASVDCTGGGFEFRTIDPGPHSVGGHVAMTFDSAGHAAFVYQDSDDQTLMLARCQNAGCGNVDIEVLDDYTHIYRSNTSIALSEAGTLAISEHWTSNYGDGGVKFILCTTAPCAGTWEHVGFMTAHPVGSEMSMALRADFTPIFSYHDDTDDTLDFDACLTADCSGVSTHQTIDGGSLGAGSFSAIAVRQDDRPVIAYQKGVTVAGGGKALYVAECLDRECATTDRFSIDLQPGLRTGEDPAIAIAADGGVMIAYFDASALKIMVAKCNPQSCRGPGDRLFDDGFDP